MSVRPKKRPLKNSSGRYQHIYIDLPEKLPNFAFLIFILCRRGVMYTTYTQESFKKAAYSAQPGKGAFTGLIYIIYTYNIIVRRKKETTKFDYKCFNLRRDIVRSEIETFVVEFSCFFLSSYKGSK